MGHERFTSRATARVANPAQITPRRRVDKLACQRGKQVAPIGSIVQIRQVSTKPLLRQPTVTLWLSFSAFCGAGEICLSSDGSRSESGADNAAKPSRRARSPARRVSCSRGGSPQGEHRCIAPKALGALAPRGSIVQIRRVSTKPLSKQRTVNCPLNKK